MSSTSEHKFRSWPIIILTITLAYLVVELSFSSTLLSIVSSQASATDVEHIEKWGRLISGFAAGLVFWSVLTPKLLGSVNRALLINIIVTLMIMIVIFDWQKSIVDSAQTTSRGSERKLAVYAEFLRTGLINDAISLEGMPSGNNVYTEGDGKAFIALSPLLAITQDNMKDRVDGVKYKVISDNIENSIGGSTGFYNKIFRKSAHEMNSAWDKFREMVGKLNLARQQANRANSDAEKNRMISRSRKDFDEAIAKAFSVPNAPAAKINPSSATNPEDFFKNPVIARFWESKLGIKGITPMMPNDSYERITRDVWSLYLKEQTDLQIREFNADSSEYDDNGSLAQKGKDAVAMLTVPAMALMLSVLFTLVHASKVTFYLVQVIHQNSSKWLAFILATTLSLVLTFTFNLSSTAITNAPLYTSLLSNYSENQEGIWPAWSLTWVIQAERFIYPIAEKTRATLLNGFNFGVANI